jgi:hypothetical protein
MDGDSFKGSEVTHSLNHPGFLFPQKHPERPQLFHPPDKQALVPAKEGCAASFTCPQDAGVLRLAAFFSSPA